MSIRELKQQDNAKSHPWWARLDVSDDVDESVTPLHDPISNKRMNDFGTTSSKGKGIELEVSGGALNLDRLASDNNYYRRVIHTTEHQQLVIMSLNGNGVPREMHFNSDQFIKVVKGWLTVYIGEDPKGVGFQLREGDSFTVKAGTWHALRPVVEPFVPREHEVKIYTIYSPPMHLKGEWVRDNPLGEWKTYEDEDEEYERHDRDWVKEQRLEYDTIGPKQGTSASIRAERRKELREKNLREERAVRTVEPKYEAEFRDLNIQIIQYETLVRHLGKQLNRTNEAVRRMVRDITDAGGTPTDYDYYNHGVAEVAKIKSELRSAESRLRTTIEEREELNTQVENEIDREAESLGVDLGLPIGGSVQQTMHEFKHGTLHSGSKTGPKVTNRKQAIAIALSQARKSGHHVPKSRTWSSHTHYPRSKNR